MNNNTHHENGGAAQEEENVFTRNKAESRGITKSLRLPLIALGALVVVGGGYYWWSTQNSYVLPEGETKQSTIVVNNEEKDVLETQDVKHSIPLEEIISGGVPKDGIPPIDDPFFVPTADAPEWLGDDLEGISFVQGTTERFYPFSVLVAHEIVNDIIDDKRVLVTYCPLCLTGVVFDPIVDGQQVEFGVSGKLWNSNLLMYNRGSADAEKESLWSQITGEGVVGEHTGVKLTVLDSDIVTFGAWKAAHPEGEILAGENGRLESYTRIPYGGNLRDIKPFFPVSNEDDRLGETALIFGIEIDGQFKAYEETAVRSSGKEIQDTFAGKNLIIDVDEKEDAVRIYEVAANETRTRISAIPSFWFSWAAVHPETELYK